MDEKTRQLRELILDLKILMNSCKQDFDSEIWGNWPKYVDEYNRLRSKEPISEYADIPIISHVPSSALSSMMGIGGGMPVERAKIREIENQTNRIIQRLELDIPFKDNESSFSNCDSVLQLIFHKFHNVVIQLRRRHDNRSTLDVNDEYDVQDLLHALLKLFFSDIRDEEWTPSYAGKSTRMDYLLKNEKTVIEVKKTRQGLKDKDIGDQLIDDIVHYKEHKDCDILYCFVYDPENRIVNPDGLERDLNTEDGEITVRVFVTPKVR